MIVATRIAFVAVIAFISGVFFLMAMASAHRADDDDDGVCIEDGGPAG